MGAEFVGIRAFKVQEVIGEVNKLQYLQIRKLGKIAFEIQLEINGKSWK